MSSSTSQLAGHQSTERPMSSEQRLGAERTKLVEQLRCIVGKLEQSS